jgi:hypothetical protein
MNGNFLTRYPSMDKVRPASVKRKKSATIAAISFPSVIVPWTSSPTNHITNMKNPIANCVVKPNIMNSENISSTALK